MENKSFLATEVGRLALAGLLVLLSFPVIYCGIRLSVGALAYVGMAMIVVGMAIPPVMSFAHRDSKE